MEGIRKKALEWTVAGFVIGSAAFAFDKAINSLEDKARAIKRADAIYEMLASDPEAREKHPGFFPPKWDYSIFEIGVNAKESAEDLYFYYIYDEVIEAYQNALMVQQRVQEFEEIRKNSREISDYIIDYLENNESRIIGDVQMLPDQNCAFKDRG